MTSVESLREAERIANDYHRSSRPGSSVGHERLGLAAGALRAVARERPGAERVGLLGCAQLLDAIADATARGAAIDARVLDVALGVASYVEGLRA